MWCILVYKTILIKKNITYSFKTHTILHSLSQTCHIMITSMDRLLSLWNVKVHEVRLEKTKQENIRRCCLHQSGSFHTSKFIFTKMSFVHEQVSDMQTSTLSRNKYTRSPKKQNKEVSGGLTASDKCDTRHLDRGYTETFYSMMIFVCHQQYGHTDIIGQGHFFQAFNQKS